MKRKENKWIVSNKIKEYRGLCFRFIIDKFPNWAWNIAPCSQAHVKNWNLYEASTLFFSAVIIVHWSATFQLFWLDKYRYCYRYRWLKIMRDNKLQRDIANKRYWSSAHHSVRNITLSWIVCREKKTKLKMNYTVERILSELNEYQVESDENRC